MYFFYIFYLKKKKKKFFLSTFRMVKINNKHYKNFKIEIKQYDEIEIVVNKDIRTVKLKKRREKRNLMTTKNNYGK